MTPNNGLRNGPAVRPSSANSEADHCTTAGEHVVTATVLCRGALTAHNLRTVGIESDAAVTSLKRSNGILSKSRSFTTINIRVSKCESLRHQPQPLEFNAGTGSWQPSLQARCRGYQRQERPAARVTSYPFKEKTAGLSCRHVRMGPGVFRMTIGSSLFPRCS